MNTIQLRVKKADNREFKNWVMSIYSPEEKKESQEFRLTVIKHLGEFYLDFVTREESKELQTYIDKLANSENVELVVERHIYTENKEEVKKLRHLIELMDSYISSRKVKIVMV